MNYNIQVESIIMPAVRTSKDGIKCNQSVRHVSKITVNARIGVRGAYLIFLRLACVAGVETGRGYGEKEKGGGLGREGKGRLL